MELLGRNDSVYREGPEEFGEESRLQGVKDFMMTPTSVVVKTIGNLLGRIPCGRDNGCWMASPAADDCSMTRTFSNEGRREEHERQHVVPSDGQLLVLWPSFWSSLDRLK